MDPVAGNCTTGPASEKVLGSKAGVLPVIPCSCGLLRLAAALKTYSRMGALVELHAAQAKIAAYPAAAAESIQDVIWPKTMSFQAMKLAPSGGTG